MLIYHCLPGKAGNQGNSLTDSDDTIHAFQQNYIIITMGTVGYPTLTSLSF